MMANDAPLCDVLLRRVFLWPLAGTQVDLPLSILVAWYGFPKVGSQVRFQFPPGFG